MDQSSAQKNLPDALIEKPPKGLSKTPNSSPKGILYTRSRIQIFPVSTDFFPELPQIQKSRSSANTPLNLPNRILKNKDFEFPDIRRKGYKVVITDTDPQQKNKKNPKP